MMSEQARGFLREMESSIDPLTSFLEGDEFEFEAKSMVLLEDFKRSYFDFRRSNGFPTIGWTRDHYSTVFQKSGLSVSRMDDQPYKGGLKTGNFILGVRFTPDAQGDQDAMLMSDT